MKNRLKTVRRVNSLRDVARRIRRRALSAEIPCQKTDRGILAVYYVSILQEVTPGASKPTVWATIEHSNKMLRGYYGRM